MSGIQHSASSCFGWGVGVVSREVKWSELELRSTSMSSSQSRSIKASANRLNRTNWF